MSRARTIADFGDGIATADIDDGAVTAAKINSAVALGITQADIWRLTTDKSLTQTTTEYITANLERSDDATSGLLGSGMSESSGVFTFPETGIYLVIGIAIFQRNSAGSSRVQMNTLVSNDSGSTYGGVGSAESGITANSDSADNHGQSTSFALVDVTNSSTFRVKFDTYTENPSVVLSGNTSINKTHFTFIRLGDT